MARSRPLHYYAAATADPLRPDVAGGLLEPRYARGQLEVGVGPAEIGERVDPIFCSDPQTPAIKATFNEVGEDMAAEIEGKERTLRDVFGGDYAFTIPLYQRPYRWKEEQSQDLLDDLLGASAPGDALDDLDPYFLGSIVLVKGKRERDAEVLDGQQRLTTLTILISCLRDQSDDAIAKGLTKFLYQEGNKVEGTEDHFRLALRENDRSFFETHIMKPGGLAGLTAVKPATETQKNVRRNALMLLRRLSQLDAARLERLAQFIVQRCFLVVVSTHDFDSAYRIFSVLNDRGMDLSHADILKADVVGAISDEEKKKTYGQKWEDLEKELGTEQFEALFFHARMIHAKSKARIGLLKDFKETIQPQASPLDFIDKTLVPLGAALAEVRDGHVDFPDAVPEDTDVDLVLSCLNRVDHAEWVPPALLAIHKHRGDAKALLEILSGLERLAAGQMILRTRRDQRITRYGHVLKALEADDSLAADSSPLQLTSDERVAIASHLERDVYGTAAARLILLRVDGLLAGAGAKYDQKTISIEHVLPQSPNAGSVWMTRFTPEQRLHSVHKLGNLVLLARRKNSGASNYEFDDKKAKYFSGNGGVSPFALTTQVLKETMWTPEVVARRQSELVKLLRQAWKL